MNRAGRTVEIKKKLKDVKSIKPIEAIKVAGN